MAEVLDEFDEPIPLQKRYCTQIDRGEYEEEGSACTAQAIEGLVKYLTSHPKVYKTVLRRRRHDETNGSIVAFVKSKICTWLEGRDVTEVSDFECEQKLSTLKEDMIKVYDYTQVSRPQGRRFSQRIADRNKRVETKRHNPRPSPPPKPPLVCTTRRPLHTAYKPLSERQGNVLRQSGRLRANGLEGTSQRKRLKSKVTDGLQENQLAHGRSSTCRVSKRTQVSAKQPATPPVHPIPPPPPPIPPRAPPPPPIANKSLIDCTSTRPQKSQKQAPRQASPQDCLMKEIKVFGQKRLRKVQNRSPCGTPIAGCKQRSALNKSHGCFFNTRLIDKFKNAKSLDVTMTEPGDFEDSLFW